MLNKLGGAVLTGFFVAVDAGMEGLFGGPSVPPLRIDPESEEKEHKLQEEERTWAKEHADKIASGRYQARPPLRGIHLQWFGKMYSGDELAWHDDSILIDLARKRLYSCGLLAQKGDHARGEGALGVGLLFSPFWLLVSPYGFVRRGLYQAAERRHGMSRYGIALFEELRGQLDAETEALLVTALKNDWLLDQKMSKRVSFDEAHEFLSRSRLKHRRFGAPDNRPYGIARYWIDDEGDIIAEMVIEHQARNPAEIKIMGSRFTGKEAEDCAGYYREILPDVSDD